MTETAADYLTKIAEAIAHELELTASVKEFARGNSALLGAHAEAAVRRLIRRTVHPMRVSHGAVIDYPRVDKLKQIDVILWMPNPAPAIFEIDDFALVPRSNAFGVMEIKRSSYKAYSEDKKGADESLEIFLQSVGPQLVIDTNPASVFGVVCLLEEPQTERLKRLRDQRKVAAIFEQEKNGDVKVNARDVFDLINFLNGAHSRYQQARAFSSVQITYDRAAATKAGA